MEPILKKYEEVKKRFENIKSIHGKPFKQELLDILGSVGNVDEEFNHLRMDGTPLTKTPYFTSNKTLILDFWEELWRVNRGKARFSLNDALVIPSKLLLVINKTNELFKKKNNLSTDEVDELLNVYRKLFEIIMKLLVPQLRVFTEKSPEEHVEWSQISNALKKMKKDYNKIFECMNGPLRNAIAHESSYVAENKFIWITDKGERLEYNLEKVFIKIFDAILLVFLLYYGINEVYIKNLIKLVNQIPVKNLETAFSCFPFQ